MTLSTSNPSRITRIAIAAALVSLIVYWGLYAFEKHLRAEILIAVRASPKPPVLNGLRILFAGVDELVSSTTNVQFDHSPRRSVLILTSDDCAGCRAALTDWRTLLSTLPFNGDDQVLIASHRGQEIVAALTAVVQPRGVRVRRFAITRQAVFALATGLTVTPTTVILDHESRVRYLSHALDGDVRRGFQQQWESLKPSRVSRAQQGRDIALGQQ